MKERKTTVYTVADMIRHYENAGNSQDPYTIVRHEWSEHDFDQRTDETVLSLFDFDLNEYHKILDIGSGLGYTYNWLKRSGLPFLHYYGLDASNPLILRSMIKYIDPNSKCTFVLGNGCEIPTFLIESEPDVVISEQVFQHILECTDGLRVFEDYIKDIDTINPSRLCIQVPKLGPYDHGVTKDYLLTFFKEEEIWQIDNWYWTIARGIKRNETEHWLNSGKFKQRDLKLFAEKGLTYVDYSR